MPANNFLDCDLHSSSPEYAKRFSGVAGTWLLKIQNQLIDQFLSKHSFQNGIDVGGGHAQVIPVLLKYSSQITLLASSREACGAAEQLIQESKIKVATSNLLDFSSEYNNYDLVSCFRIISHCDDWKKLISELCQASSDLVLIDYPTLRSSNILYFISFFLKRRIEGNTREFISFWDSEIKQEFRKHGFQRIYREAQFVMPMGLHRAMKNPKISGLIEKTCSLLGLRNLFGSPIVAGFSRKSN